MPKSEVVGKITSNQAELAAFVERWVGRPFALKK